MKARQAYTFWQSYCAWVRAVEESDAKLPTWVTGAIEEYASGFTGYAAANILRDNTAPGADALWRLLERWTHEHLFRKPWAEGWMDAVGYYATKDLSVIRDWAYSEWCADVWQQNRPRLYPTFQEWRDAARRLDDETLDLMELRDDRRNLIKASRRVHPRRLSMAVGRYVTYTILGCWASAALRDSARWPETVVREIQGACPGFLDELNAVAQKSQIVDALMQRIKDRRFQRAKREGWFEVLLYRAQLHPRYARAKDYLTRMNTGWAKGRRSGYPSLASWTAAVDAYTFEPDD